MNKHRVVLAVVMVALVAFVALEGFSIPITHQSYSICRNTLSIRGYTEWPFGVRTGHWQKASPLEAFMTKHGMKFDHDWRMISNTGKNFYGRSIEFSDGKYGELSTLRPETLELWMDGRSDGEVAKFCELLKSKRDDEIFARSRQIWESVSRGG